MAKQARSALHETSISDVCMAYCYVFLWIGLSATVIMVNKYILSYADFPYPLALTLTHMAFNSILTCCIRGLNIVTFVPMDMGIYSRCVIPIAALFAGTLWLGNAAYLSLSVSLIQMVKAMAPMGVYLVSVMLKQEQYSHTYAANMVVIIVGICIACYGEMHLDFLGLALQGSSMIMESFRLVLVQILLQAKGIKLDPLSALFYISPACFAFLFIPFAIRELPAILADQSLVVNPLLLLGSATAAFALNIAVFLLIGKTSALTMNVAGVVKDWLLIGLSVIVYGAPVTGIQYAGYGLSFVGVCWYNYNKLAAARRAADTAAPIVKGNNLEVGQPLLSSRSSSASQSDNQTADKC